MLLPVMPLPACGRRRARRSDGDVPLLNVDGQGEGPWMWREAQVEGEHDADGAAAEFATDSEQAATRFPRISAPPSALTRATVIPIPASASRAGGTGAGLRLHVPRVQHQHLGGALVRGAALPRHRRGQALARLRLATKSASRAWPAWSRRAAARPTLALPARRLEHAEVQVPARSPAPVSTALELKLSSTKPRHRSPLAMQLFPGLGVREDEAWLVRFLMDDGGRRANRSVLESGDMRKVDIMLLDASLTPASINMSMPI
ncbi:hypothetical protein DFH09DRAFT_1369825 [Mycena vulgaris]|nr:hypothetical protein DFH09DRAFT_1369825 [Mycena vulgaris]